jgi:hypothetical protein
VSELPRRAAEYLTVGGVVDLFADFNATDEEGRPFRATLDSITGSGRDVLLSFRVVADRSEAERIIIDLRKVLEAEDAYLRINLRGGGNPFFEHSPGVLLPLLDDGAEPAFEPTLVAESDFEIRFHTKVLA